MEKNELCAMGCGNFNNSSCSLNIWFKLLTFPQIFEKRNRGS